MKKCLHVSANVFPPLHTPHFTKKIWVELAKGFDEYHVLARSNSNKFEHYQEDELHLHLVPRLGSRSKSFLLSSFYLFVLVKKYQITHLLAQSAMLGGFAAAIASKIFRIPLMCEIHGDIYFKILAERSKSLKNRILSKLILYVYKNSNKVRSLSSEMTAILDRFGIHNVVEIPNRVDLSLFKNMKPSYELHSPIKVISIGRFVPQKGYDVAIKAILNLSKRLPVELTLVGGGPLFNILESAADGNQSIRLIRWVDQEDLAEILVNSDIYIQPSIPGLGEAMPRTILEAMAIKVPVIASNIAAIPGVVRHGYNGILIDPGSAQALEEAILMLISDRDLRERISENAYRDVVAKYSWHEVFNRYRSALTGMSK